MLNKIATRLGILERLRASWKQDVRRETDPLRAGLTQLEQTVDNLKLGVVAESVEHHLRADLAQIVQTLDALKTELAEAAERQTRAEHETLQLRQILLWNEKHRDQLAALPRLLDAARITDHVRTAIALAPLEVDPFPHIVVEGVLPTEIYKLTLRALPPTTFFAGQSPKQNIRIPLDAGPALTCRVWEFIDDVIARDAIIPAVAEKFRDQLRSHYETIFGTAFSSRAEAMPQAASGGRVMLRRPGYYLAPHRDPKRSMVTCLMYLAKGSDNEAYGTEIYRVFGDREASYAQTYYPEQHGARCELVKVVPYRSNSMLVFVNAQGAHGARIPADAPPDLERYAYQFYVGPGLDALADLIKDLPPDRQAMWQAKKPDLTKATVDESPLLRR